MESVPTLGDQVPHSLFGGAAFQFPFHYMWTRTPDLPQWVLWSILRRLAKKNLGRRAKPFPIPDRLEMSRNEIAHL